MTTYRHNPYNTGKVLIGGAYVPPPAQMGADAEIVQGLLLYGKQPPMDKADKLAIRTCIGALIAFVVVLAVG